MIRLCGCCLCSPFLYSVLSSEMSWTPDSVARCPEHDEQPTYEEQALDDQLTQEQFNNELEKDLEVMLTQEQCDKEEGEQKEEQERLLKAKKKRMMMMMTQKRDM